MNNVFKDNPNYSYGLGCIISRNQLKLLTDTKLAIRNEEPDKLGYTVHYSASEKFYFHSDLFSNRLKDYSTIAMGAICADVLVSNLENTHFCYIPSLIDMIQNEGKFYTDITVLSTAIGTGIMDGIKAVSDNWLGNPDKELIIKKQIEHSIELFWNTYHVNYNSFSEVFYSTPKLNIERTGAASIVSYSGWIANSLKEAERLGELAAEAVGGSADEKEEAHIISGCIYLLRAMRFCKEYATSDKQKERIKEYVSEHYNLSYDIEDYHKMNDEKKSSISPIAVAVVCFLNNYSYMSCIAETLYAGGPNCKKIAAIAGSLMEITHDVPDEVRGIVLSKLDRILTDSICKIIDFQYSRYKIEIKEYLNE